jgi:hypothetical protein
MAELGVLTAQKVWLDGYDVTGRINAIALDESVEAKDNTAFGDDTRSAAPGLFVVRARVEGYAGFGTGEPDDIAAGVLGVADKVISIAATGSGADGELAFTFPATAGEYVLGGAQVGEMMPFSLAADGRGVRLVRGTVMHNAQRTGAGTGTARQLGAVATGSHVYAGIHVVEVTGGSVTVNLYSDDNAGMTSPTLRATTGAIAAIGGRWLSCQGPVTDDYWRMTWSMSATSATFVAVVGIR